MNAEEAKSFLTSYLDALERRDWDFVVPRQDKASRLVKQLCDRPRFPRLQGAAFPHANIANQKQTVQIALANLEDDPSRLEDHPDEPSPWDQTAQELDRLASTMPEGEAWTAQATEAAQIVRYVNPATANQIEKTISAWDLAGPDLAPNARAQVIAAIKGAATGARLLGALPAAGQPGTVVNVSQQQSLAAVTVTSIRGLLDWDELPDDVRPALTAMESAAENRDKPEFMKSASEFAEQASKFPNLVAKIGDAWDWVAGLGIF